MDYREISPPPDLRLLVRAAWTLDGGGEASAMLPHSALPDGCVEIIHRLRGRSAWRTGQPAAFVAGLVTAPAELMLSGDSRFLGLRLWPWGWNAVARIPSPALVDRWEDLAVAAPGLALAATAEAVFATMGAVRLDPRTAALGEAILASRSVEALSAASGLPHRSLQRWFARHIGVPPRRYLRLLRFQETLAGLQRSDETLALQAAEHGFADQSHMAREFRAIAGARAGTTRRTAKGPFL